MSIKAFYATSLASDEYQHGILIYPLPDSYQILSDRIYKALKSVGISSIDFIITDSNAVRSWCKAVGIETIQAESIMGIWTDKDPLTCIKIVEEVVEEFNA